MDDSLTISRFRNFGIYVVQKDDKAAKLLDLSTTRRTRSDKRKNQKNTKRETPTMQTMQEIFNRQKKALFFLLALFGLGWFFTDYPTIFAGLILGSLFGLYNFWILVRRMARFERAITEQTRGKSIGTALRFASGVAAAAIALSLPEEFNLISTVIGLMIPYILLLADRLLFHTKH